MDKELLKLRQEIDKCDKDLLLVLKRRFRLTAKVGKLKAKKDLPIKDLKREEEKIKSVLSKWSPKLADPNLIRRLFVEIIKEVRKNHQGYRKAKNK